MAVGVDAIGGWLASRGWSAPLAVPLGLIAIEEVYSVFTPARDVGASTYHPMWPDLVAGPAVGALILLAFAPRRASLRLR
jgi:hypothetical protein